MIPIVTLATNQEVQARYLSALHALVAKLQQDRYVLAAVLWGSLARGEAWRKSDIDLTIVMEDGQRQEMRGLWLVQDGINVMAEVVTRNRFKRYLEGALQGSFTHSIQSQSKLLFSKDESIAAWFADSSQINARDQDYAALAAAANLTGALDKAQKWLYWKDDPLYSFVWIMFVVNDLARVEVVLNGEAPGREVIHQALKFNPEFFNALYTAFVNGPKNRETIHAALELIDAYLLARVERIYKPVLDYLAEAEGPRTAAEMNQFFQKKVQMGGISGAYEWLTEKGIIQKVSSPVRLTKKSQVELDEPAYFYEADEPDWV